MLAPTSTTQQAESDVPGEIRRWRETTTKDRDRGVGPEATDRFVALGGPGGLTRRRIAQGIGKSRDGEETDLVSKHLGASSSEQARVSERDRALDWALASGFQHDRRMANAGCGDRHTADTDRRLSRRLARRP